VTTSYQAMATSHQLDTSLEVLTNLLHLIRLTLDDPAKASSEPDITRQLIVQARSADEARVEGATDRQDDLRSPGHRRGW
jgi:hypothetical protein